MRTIYINGKFYGAGLNGVHRAADRLIRELDKLIVDAPELFEGVEFVLLTPTRANTVPALTKIKVQPDPRGHTQLWEQIILPWRSRGSVLVSLCNLAPILKAAKITIIHDAQFCFPGDSYPFRLKVGYRVLIPLVGFTSRAVITVSEYSRQTLGLLSIASAEKTRVIYNGADHIEACDSDRAILTDLNLQVNGFAVHIASTKHYKNSAVVFAAFESAELKGTRLVIVGPSRDELVAEGLSPPANAIWAGRIPDPALKALYETATCLLFPSRTEGFGLPPIEAMRCGCVAVSSPAGAIPEVCRDATVYADVDDPASWIAAILMCRDDSSFRRAKAEAGRRRSLEFTWSRAARELWAVIKQSW